MVGVFDLLRTVLCTAEFVDVISQAMNIAIGGSDDYRPLWWLLVYVMAIGIATPGRRFFWNTLITVTSMTIILMLMYCIGLAPRLDFGKWAMLEVKAFEGSPHTFFNQLLVPTIYFVGMDLIVVFGDEIKEPQQTIPRGMLSAVLIAIGLGWWVTLTCVSNNPGVGGEMMDVEIIFPMHFGFEQLLHTGHAVAHYNRCNYFTASSSRN